MIQHSFRYSVTFVTDRYRNSIEILLNLDVGFAGARVEMDVGETALNDAKNRKFGFFR